MIRSIAAYLFAAFIAVIPAATAQVTVNISEGTLKPTPIAIPVFEAEGADRQLATDITSVVQNAVQGPVSGCNSYDTLLPLGRY